MDELEESHFSFGLKRKEEKSSSVLVNQNAKWIYAIFAAISLFPVMFLFFNGLFLNVPIGKFQIS